MGRGQQLDSRAKLGVRTDHDGCRIEEDAAHVDEGPVAERDLGAVVADEGRLDPGIGPEAAEELGEHRADAGGVGRVGVVEAPPESAGPNAGGQQFGITGAIELAPEHLCPLTVRDERLDPGVPSAFRRRIRAPAPPVPGPQEMPRLPPVLPRRATLHQALLLGKEHPAQRQGPEVEARSEHGVGRQAFQARPVGTGRLRGGDAEAERWLHHQIGHQRRHDAEGQRGQQRRALEPALGRQHDEQQSETGSDEIVDGPACRALVRLLLGRGDAAMNDGAARHVEHPASEQAVAQRGDVEAPLQEQRPEVDHEGGAESDENRAEDVP